MKIRSYYNEFDPFAAQWLRNLISAGEIPAGDVDERSISDVKAADLTGYIQCHFFAGIGGWSVALQLSGWPVDRPVWTGSCPCQPYSAAGKGKGDSDPRNLWPEFFRLIRECRPEHIIGEQVASAIGHGWLDGISADMEGENYAVGAVVLGAHSVGAPHIRQRLHWMAHDHNSGRENRRAENGSENRSGDRIRGSYTAVLPATPEHCSSIWMADAQLLGRQQFASDGCRGVLPQTPGPQGEQQQSGDRRASESYRLGDTAGERCGETRTPESNTGTTKLPPSSVAACGMGDTDNPRPQGRGFPQHTEYAHKQPSGEISAWSESTLILCRDGKYRRVPRAQSEVLGVAPRVSAELGQPCADRFPLTAKSKGRAGRLKGYGNAIVPQVAAAFISAWMEVAQ